MRLITPSILFALLALSICLWFLYRCGRAAWDRPDLGWLQPDRPALRFSGPCHPMEKKDRLPVLLITLIYACTAFFQLGDLSAPQEFTDFGDGKTVSIQISGSPVRAQTLRYYCGLGTGGYNVEASTDGVNWSTLWQHKDENGKVTGWYWADAEGYEPSYALEQGYNQLFKWIDIELDNPIDIQYLRITGRADNKWLPNGENQKVLELGRLALVDGSGQAVPFNWGRTDGDTGEVATLFAAMGVPDKSTWHNSTYFDEIYHARTAKEHIDGLYPYEVTHPPLGKLILGIGIRLFGMTPFGWRFMGTLFGVLMLPLLYVFLKNLFGKTAVAACGTTLFAAEFMHLTQTRIATIDTYGVFFILGMYFFLYRYLTLPAGTPFRKGALPLFLSGLLWGIGVSSKWTVIYGGLGLAVLYFMGFYQKLRDWPQEARGEKGKWVAATLSFSVLVFILMPLTIYTLSYLPYARSLGVDLSLGNTLHGLAEGLGLLFHNVLDKLTGAAGAEGYVAASIPQDSLGGIMANNQWYMLTYHQGVTSSHPYSSWWFQWIVDGRPILYYMDNGVTGYTTRFAAFANPILCWTGLGAILACFAASFRRLGSKLAFLWGLGISSALLLHRVQQTPNGVFDPTLEPQVLRRNLLILIACLLLYLALSTGIALIFRGSASAKCAFVTVGYLSQLVPWMFIGRTTFEYHYFPSLLFLVLAVSLLMDRLTESDRAWKGPVYGLTGAAVGCFALFYPVLIGLQIPTWYEPMVKWLESWPF